MNKQSRKSRSKRGEDDLDNRQRDVVVRLDRLTSIKTITAVKIVSTSVLVTDGSGYITMQSVVSDQARTTGSNWSSFASRFKQFRVRAIRIRLFPLVDVTTALTAGGGAVTPHPTALAFAAYREGLGYSNFASLCAGADSRIFNGREKIISYSTDWSNNPEAKFWCQTNAVIPTEQQFGFQYRDTGTAPASSATTTYYRIVTEWDTEFMEPY